MCLNYNFQYIMFNVYDKANKVRRDFFRELFLQLSMILNVPYKKIYEKVMHLNIHSSM